MQIQPTEPGKIDPGPQESQVFNSQPRLSTEVGILESGSTASHDLCFSQSLSRIELVGVRSHLKLVSLIHPILGPFGYLCVNNCLENPRVSGIGAQTCNLAAFSISFHPSKNQKLSVVSCLQTQMVRDCSQTFDQNGVFACLYSLHGPVPRNETDIEA